MITMDEVCGYVRNYFLKEYRNPQKYIHNGTFVISGGRIQDLPFLVSGQWFRITGSALNNGVYQYPDAELTDETFEGAVWEMYVPADFVSLVTEIDGWVNDNFAALNGPYQSESFGGYSYTKGYSTRANGTSVVGGWQTQFGARLSRFRRVSVL